ncbi:MAG: ABC transporter permease, partial [Chitinophagales bacterium]
LILLWVNDELSFDKFYEKESQLYQLMEHRKFPDRIDLSDESNGILAETLAKENPEIEYWTTTAPAAWFQKFTLAVGDKSLKAAGQYASRDYFKVFSFKLTEGNEDQVLADKNAIVISESLAKRLFNTTKNIVGKTILFQNQRPFAISGIFQNLPANSSEQFDFLLPFEFYKDNEVWVRNWKFPGTGPHNYIILKKGTDLNAFNKKISGIIERNGGEPFRTAYAMRFSENYLANNFMHGVRVDGKLVHVKIFSMVAVMILFIACINFMNLSTAKASRRFKEVGIKKVVGASRLQLIIQFMSESLLLAFFSMAIAMAMVIFLVPEFNRITGKEISLGINSRLILSLLGITIFTGIIAGSYPAFYISRFKPLSVLRERFTGGGFGALMARKGLVIFQFALSVLLIIGVLVVYEQMKFIQDRNPGFNKDNIIRFDSEGKILGNQENFISGLKRVPGVVNASGTSHNTIGRVYGIYDLQWPGKSADDKSYFEVMPSGYDYIDLMGMKMAAGRDFTKNYVDSEHIIINEAAARTMGFKEPVGRVVKMFSSEREIIGVVQDFNFESMHETVKPLIISLDILDRSNWYKIMVKLKSGYEKETIERIRKYYSAYNPGFPFDYNYLDQAYEKQYEAEKRVFILSRYFASLAILISCLGLLGLVAFAAQMRQKEIGIRKVIGASVSNMVVLLSTDFLKLVLIGAMIAIPLAWLGLNQWLNSFAYRIHIGFSEFLITGIAVALVSLLTVSSQAVKAALANPLTNLRTE